MEIRAWREPSAALIQRDLGLAYFDLAANQHGDADLRRAYEILSHLPAPQRQEPLVEADIASVLLAQGQTDFAIRLFTRASAQEPSNARYAYCLGAALARSGKMEDALKELRRSIKLDPSRPDAYLELAQLYEKSGHRAQSRDIIQEYLRFMPQNIELRSAE